ncbi:MULTISPECIES: glycogen synthase [Chryseobacterium]|uniref:glycogen synthase n=1 Tax=Chryseobacterium TaxID=59732 RepID=UPI00195C3A71|nr:MULTISPECIES: glycogen/starch synthase [Chryseobacterium]MBM7419740.1 starch synthase [Chryseobacterium sp. JUb44]MDH6209673.1 starch synthase [Chryseobacterium sp. BIGb0186]WSO08424.1 glycogen/starch synthase [Chryseobacterium scophthalmum]
MTIFHLSTECYPVAKVGGLADVVGALPKYQNKIKEVNAKVVMPWYNKHFVYDYDFEVVFDGFIHQGSNMLQVQVMKETTDVLGFELFMVKIPGLLDRENPYGYEDESFQFLAFQQGVLHWLTAMKIRPDVLHCHDYHTGLVPFMIENCEEFEFLKGVKTIGTIHNGEYQGMMSWDMVNYMPAFDHHKWGLLDWNGFINPLASMIKCCSAFTTVSEGYLEELFVSFRGLESLVREEFSKAYGIINGIDTDVWNPQTDPMIDFNFNSKNALKLKKKNKAKLCKEYGLNPELPLFAFIGRFATEKGADLLPDLIWRSIKQSFGGLNIIVLGSGNAYIEQQLKELDSVYSNFATDIGYKEHLSHKIYASADFLLMPSRVEPCGLNQMYAMRYGTVPVVSYTGGLRDTVKDITTGGSGLNFTYPGVDDIIHAMSRGVNIYKNKAQMDELVLSNMKFDFAWEKSAEKYLTLYKN